MSPETLKKIKEELTKLCKMYEILSEDWNGVLQNGKDATYPHVVIILVLLQNMAHDASDCYGYNHEDAVKKLHLKFKTLKSLNDYMGRDQMTHFAYVEADNIISGYEMSEIYE